MKPETKPETKPFDPTKPYRTRDGREAKIVHTFKDGRHLLVVVECMHNWTVNSDGKYVNEESEFDLINIPEKKTIEFWVNVYPSLEVGSSHPTKRQADFCARDRIACLHFTREYEEGEGL